MKQKTMLIFICALLSLVTIANAQCMNPVWVNAFAEPGNPETILEFDSPVASPADLTFTTNSFDNRTFGTNQNAIELTATVTNEEVIIELETEREVNIRQYILERNTGGNDYEMIAVIQPKNSYSLRTIYSIPDNEVVLQPGTKVQYRLRIVSMNGSQLLSALTVERVGEGLISGR